jgi:hypothetical protein
VDHSVLAPVTKKGIAEGDVTLPHWRCGCLSRH